MSDYKKEIMEEFKKEFVIDPSEIFFGKKEELEKQGWEVGGSKLILRQDIKPEDIDGQKAKAGLLPPSEEKPLKDTDVPKKEKRGR